MSFETTIDVGLTTVGSRMRAVRLALGLGRMELADALKVSGPMISAWERGREDVPDKRIEEFAALTKAPSDWLLLKSELPPSWRERIAAALLTVAPEKSERKNERGKVPPYRADAPVAPPSPAPENRDIIEIAPAMKDHVGGLNTEQPEARWSIPLEVLRRSFNCNPNETVLKRVQLAMKMPDGTPVKVGDYVLIDPTRNEINSPGVYYVSDDETKPPKRVRVEGDEEAGEFRVYFNGNREPVGLDQLSAYSVVGRIMTVFHSV